MKYSNLSQNWFNFLYVTLLTSTNLRTKADHVMVRGCFGFSIGPLLSGVPPWLTASEPGYLGT